MGIAFIVAGSLSDAMAANYEEKVFFSRHPEKKFGCAYVKAMGWAVQNLGGIFFPIERFFFFAGIGVGV